jgi:hypothetical protein
MILTHESGSQEDQFDEKKWRQKISWDYPFNVLLCCLSSLSGYIFCQLSLSVSGVGSAVDLVVHKYLFLAISLCLSIPCQLLIYLYLLASCLCRFLYAKSATDMLLLFISALYSTICPCAMSGVDPDVIYLVF